jgi:hypothetical protein
MELPREFSLPRWQVIAHFALALGCLSLGVFALRTNQASGAPAFVAGGLLFTGFAIHLAATRVKVSETELLVGSIFGNITYLRADVLAVNWEYGNPISIDVAGRGWTRLPYMGADPAALHATLKHWISDPVPIE